MVLIIIIIINTDEDPNLRIETFVIVNLGGFSTKLYFVLNRNLVINNINDMTAEFNLK